MSTEYAINKYTSIQIYKHFSNYSITPTVFEAFSEKSVRFRTVQTHLIFQQPTANQLINSLARFL